MENNQLNKFNSKLTLEAVFKAVLLGLSVGFASCGLIALITWLAGFKDGIWVALGAGFGFGVLTMPLFYLLFRPTEVQTARRVDALGLQERAVTMLEYQQDDSLMASRQRANANDHIAATDASAIPFVIPMWIVSVLVCTFLFCASFVVVGLLFKLQIIDNPIGPANPLEQFVAATYIAEDGGEIIGETDQLLSPGEDATTVTAVAMNGYMFVGWNDGNNNPERTDLNITEDLEIYAMFEALDGDGDGEQVNGDVPGNEGDQATDQPGDDGGQAEGGDGDGSGDKGDGEGSGSGDQNKGDGKGDGQGEGAGGKWSEGNKIINGEIFYRDYLDQYHADAMQELTALDDLPPEIREFIEAYYESV